MPLWASALLIIILAILIDRFIGEFPNRYHPLRWMGNVLGWIDRRLDNRNGTWAKVVGLLSYIFIFLLFGGTALLITSLLRTQLPEPYGEISWIIASAFILKISFAIFSFRKHCEPICKDLEEGRTEDAAEKVSMIVSRKTKGMDAEQIASSCCETISENYADSVCTPTFYIGIMGIPGAFIFRCANLMDAMWGYKNERYVNVGRFPAIWDDILGFLTSRLSALFMALGSMILGMNWRRSLSLAQKENDMTPSPNSGWPMTAAAGALDISMEKKGEYVMNKEAPLPDHNDVRRCLHLIEFSSILFIIIVTAPLFMALGVHVQVFFEDLIIGALEWILRLIL